MALMAQQPLGEPDPFDDSAQVAVEARKADVTRLQREREVDDFKWLMGNKQGRRVMWRLMSMTGLFCNPYQPSAPPGFTEFQCGKQDIGQRLLGEVHELCPEKYNTMVEEQQAWLTKLK